MASSEKKRQSQVAVVGANVAIGLIKAMMFTYDIATLPIYTVVQKPWVVWKNRLVFFLLEEEASIRYVKPGQSHRSNPKARLVRRDPWAWSSSFVAAL